MTSPRGHIGDVVSVDWSPDGRTLASAGADGTVRVWDVPAGELVRVLDHDGDPLSRAQWSPDGSLLLTCDDGSTQIWEVTGGEVVARIDEGRGSAGWSPDGQHIAHLAGGRLRIWDVAAGEFVAVWEGLPIAWRVLWPSEFHILVWSSGGIGLFDIEVGEHRVVSEAGFDACGCVFPRTGEVVLSGAMEGSSLSFLDPSSGALSLVRADDEPESVRHPGEELLGVRRVDIAPLADGLALGAMSKREDQLLATTLRAHDREVPLWVVRGHIQSLACSPDGAQIATGGVYCGDVKIWDPARGEVTTTFSGRCSERGAPGR